MSNRNGKIALK